MSENPWLVHNIQSFLYLNCPECGFKTKMKNYFQDHAIKKHPLSCEFFEKSIVQVIFSERGTKMTSQLHI